MMGKKDENVPTSPKVPNCLPLYKVPKDSQASSARYILLVSQISKRLSILQQVPKIMSCKYYFHIIKNRLWHS